MCLCPSSAVSLPRGAMGLSGVGDCGICWSYSLFFFSYVGFNYSISVSSGYSLFTQKVCEYDQEIPQSHTADHPTAP